MTRTGVVLGSGKTREQRLADERFEELLEQAYWNFDGSNYQGGQGGQETERAAFKAAVRRFVAETRTPPTPCKPCCCPLRWYIRGPGSSDSSSVKAKPVIGPFDSWNDCKRAQSRRTCTGPWFMVKLTDHEAAYWNPVAP